MMVEGVREFMPYIVHIRTVGVSIFGHFENE